MTTTDASEAFQIPIEAAEAYESRFVPAFFAQWAPIMCDAAGIVPGRRVLDVACGTGVVARAAAERVGDDRVAGVDLNEAMLTVARRVRPGVDWRQGDVAALPFADGSFDAVLCQMALMFFPDRAKAVAEMARVAADGGAVVLNVPAALDRQPAYGPFVEMATGVAGPDAESLLSAYFSCGGLDGLARLLEGAGLRVVDRSSPVGVLRSPSVDELVATEVESTPLIERITDAEYRRIREGARDVFAPFTAADGSVDAPFEVCIVVARRG